MLTHQIRLNSTSQTPHEPNHAAKVNDVKPAVAKPIAAKPAEPKPIARKRHNPPAQDWEKAKRKRARKGSKDWRRQRLEWRDTDKERRHYQQRWMKFSQKPGKKPLPVFTHRSNCISAPQIPLNQILNLIDR